MRLWRRAKRGWKKSANNQSHSLHQNKPSFEQLEARILLDGEGLLGSDPDWVPDDNQGFGGVEVGESYVMLQAPDPNNPEIEVRGNDTEIINGDMIPDGLDGTDFGVVDVNGEIATHTFIIYNFGDIDLNLEGFPLVELDGSSDFEVVVDPDSTINPDKSTSFQIQFDPSSEGVVDATVRIENDDKDEGVYEFAIMGTGYTNTAPDQPEGFSPAGDDVELDPVLMASPFSDMNIDDSHISSQWQIATDFDFTNVIWDKTEDTGDLTEGSVPLGVLSGGTDYFFRVRHEDSSGAANAWSDWSDPVQFTTKSNPSGIPYAEEMGPTGLDADFDGNMDGTPDWKQDNVVSFYTVTGKYATLASDVGTTLVDVKSIDNPSPDPLPASIESPYGFYEYTIEGLAVGGSAVVDLYLEAGDGALINAYHKYGPTPVHPVDHWYDFLFDGQTGAVISGDIISITYVDGLKGDDDLTANGEVVEPSGPVMDLTPPVVTVDTLLTNDTTPALTGTVDDPDAMLLVTQLGGSQVYIATNNGDGSWVLPDDIYSFPGEGTFDVLVVGIDQAGNVDKDGTVDEIEIDTTAPVVTVDTLLTNDQTPALTGTVNDLSAVIEVVVNGKSYTAINNLDTTWTLADDTIDPPLVEGVYDVAVTATDPAGNQGTDTTIDELEVDITDPVVTVDELLTNQPSPTLTGTIDDATAKVWIDVGLQAGVEATNNGDGTWTLPSIKVDPLLDGTYDVIAYAEDGAGNTDTDDTLDELTIDTVPPKVTVDDILTHSLSPEITGTIDDLGAEVFVIEGSTHHPALNNGDNTWTLPAGTLSFPAEGVYDVFAIGIDKAQNVGPDTTYNELTIDTTVPVVTVDALLTNDNRPELTGTVNDNDADIEVEVAGTKYAAINNLDGTWTLTDNSITPELADGIYDLAVHATDPAGNVGMDTTLDELIVDTTAPVASVDDLVTSDTTPQLSGTVGDKDATVQLTVGGQTHTVINNHDGTWTLLDNTISPELAEGVYDVFLTATDLAGNAGVVTGTLTVQEWMASADTPKVIGDNQTTLSTRLVAGMAGDILDVDVRLDITHPWVGDLDVYLISPSGTRVELFTDVGAGGQDFTDTILDDEASDAIVSGAAPFTGRFRPEGFLSDLKSENPNGLWTLEITDDNPKDEGVLNDWALHIKTTGVGSPDIAVAGDTDFGCVAVGGDSVTKTFSIMNTGNGPLTLNGSPRVTVTGSSDFTVVTQPPVSVPAGGTVTFEVRFDPSGEGTKTATLSIASNDSDEDPTTLLLEGKGVIPAPWYPSADVPLAITDNGTVMSSLSVNGLVGTVCDVDVQVDIDHDWDGDLDVTLISPKGTRVELFSDVGGKGQDFDNTILDDEAQVGIVDGSAPFAGTYRPEGMLSDLDGEDPNGIWQLEIKDDSAKDVGQLNNWALRIKTTNALYPEITVKGNGIEIYDGDTTPSPADATDFGVVNISGGSVGHLFTIENQGSAVLTLDPLTLTGSSDFKITQPLQTTTLNPGASTTFAVAFNPSSTGFKTATVILENNDSDEDPYNFVVQGQGWEDPYWYESMDVPYALFDLQTITSQLLVDGIGGVISDIDVYVDITHEYLGDLDVYLISPNGTRVELMTDVGGDGQDFYGTILDDEAAAPITTGSHPFVGSYQPEGLLSTLDGQNPNGLWGLEVSDAMAPYTGQLLNWAIRIDTTPVLNNPEIRVQGNGMEIVDGDMSPDIIDGTDFGNTTVTGGGTIRTFTIDNMGSQPLVLDGTPTVSLTGSSDFSVFAQPASSLVPGAATTFQIQFNPSSLGMKTATVSIDNNDSNEDPYTFTIQGIGTSLMPFFEILDAKVTPKKDLDGDGYGRQFDVAWHLAASQLPAEVVVEVWAYDTSMPAPINEIKIAEETLTLTTQPVWLELSDVRTDDFNLGHGEWEFRLVVKEGGQVMTQRDHQADPDLAGIRLELGLEDVVDPHLDNYDVLNGLIDISLADSYTDPVTNDRVLTFTISNTSVTPIGTPLYLNMNLEGNPHASLKNLDGIDNKGRPFYDISSLLTGGRLNPGESINVEVVVHNPLGGMIALSYNLFGETVYP